MLLCVKCASVWCHVLMSLKRGNAEVVVLLMSLKRGNAKVVLLEVTLRRVLGLGHGHCDGVCFGESVWECVWQVVRPES